MPSTASCPGCKQTLSVDDQYAGMQGKCPTCGTLVVFPAAAAPTIPAAPFTAQPPPALPPVEQPTVFPSAAPQAPPAPFTLAGLDPIASIAVPAGLFFLAMVALACLLPWRGFSGLAWANATLLFLECLLVGAFVGSTTYFKENLHRGVLVGATFGTFAFLVLIGEISRASRGGGAGAGLWIGLVAALGTIASFGALAVVRPVDWPYMKALNMPPAIQRYGALGASQGGAFLFGFLYLLITLASR
jgi:hypothetical protein